MTKNTCIEDYKIIKGGYAENISLLFSWVLMKLLLLLIMMLKLNTIPFEIPALTKNLATNMVEYLKITFVKIWDMSE